jgi:hypothetical protein
MTKWVSCNQITQLVIGVIVINVMNVLHFRFQITKSATRIITRNCTRPYLFEFLIRRLRISVVAAKNAARYTQNKIELFHAAPHVN